MGALASQTSLDAGPLTAAALSEISGAQRISRGASTWYCYLLLGLQTYLFNIQGNAIPFLQSELHLSYRVASLHSSAIAAGMIVVGLFGERLSRRFGRQATLCLGAGGMAVGAVLLCLAPATWATVASCGLIGLMAALIISVVPALLADLHPYRRDAAFAEATAVSCAFGILAPLASGLFLWSTLGWRYAVTLGAAYGGLILVRFGRTPLAEPAHVTKSARDKLPPSYWAYWCLLMASVALEFSVLLWAPAFIERVAGFAATSAAAVASGFSVGMLAGRFATSWLVRTISPRLVFLAALAIALFGFGIYWGIDQPLGVMVGIFLLGLGIAPLYPLTLSFAIGVAGGASDAASARCLVGGGFAILVAPAILGALADVVGLRLAHLTLPALVTFALASFLVAHQLERRKVAQSQPTIGSRRNSRT